MKKTIYILLLLSVIFSCKEKEEVREDDYIARVGEEYLYKKDIESIIKNYNNDSSSIVDNIINSWVIEQLEYREAKKNISKNNPEIEKLINEYRVFLYVDRFKKEYVKNSLDTIVNKASINEWYSKNKSLYILDENIIRATYIKTDIKAPKLYKLKQWLRSDKIEDKEQISAYCVKNAEKYDDFDDNWVAFDDIVKNIPKEINNSSSFLKYYKKIEARDSASYYLVYIKEHKLIGDTCPVDYIQHKVAQNIIKQRKKEMLINLKNNLLEEGKLKKIVEIK